MKKMFLISIVLVASLFSYKLPNVEAMHDDIPLEDYKREQDFRKANGLEYSKEAIEKAMKSEVASASKNEYGIELTKKELEILQRNDKLIKDYKPIIEKALKSKSKNYTLKDPKLQGYTIELIDIGSYHIDTTDGLKFIISLSKVNEETNKVINLLTKEIPKEHLIIKEVKNSEKELVESYFQINEELKDKFNEFNIMNISVNIPDNVVDIEVEQLERGIISKLESRFNKDIIRIIQGTSYAVEERATSRQNIGGGLKITDSLYNCTSGFTATKNTNRFLVTAGHCNESSTQTNWRQGGSVFGTEHFDYNGNYADIGLLRVTSTSRKIFNGIYKYSAYDSNYTSWQTSINNLSVGDKICVSGQKTGFQCGTVESKFSNKGSYVGYVKVSNGIDTTNGDSGAPYWYNGVLMGIHSAGETSGPPFALMSHISYALQYGGAVTPYTSSTPK